MRFFAVCRDKPDSSAVRQAARPDHLAYLKAHEQFVDAAGPILADDGETIIGSLLLYRAEDARQVQTLLQEDPYVKAGLFASTEVHPWRWVIKSPD